MPSIKTKSTCVIYGRKFYGQGNNTWPIAEKGECCTACNLKHVIPARIDLLHTDEDGATVYACDED